jgi:hypothetical protein
MLVPKAKLLREHVESGQSELLRCSAYAQCIALALQPVMRFARRNLLLQESLLNKNKRLSLLPADVQPASNTSQAVCAAMM